MNERCFNDDLDLNMEGHVPYDFIPKLFNVNECKPESYPHLDEKDDQLIYSAVLAARDLAPIERFYVIGALYHMTIGWDLAHDLFTIELLQAYKQVTR